VSHRGPGSIMIAPFLQVSTVQDMSAGWMKSAFARHALLENTQMPVEQALSLYARIVLLAASRIYLQRAVMSAQRGSTPSQVIHSAFHAKQELGIVMKEPQGATYANKGSTQPPSEPPSLSFATYAQRESTPLQVMNTALCAKQGLGTVMKEPQGATYANKGSSQL
jgi:hypothetical protein